MKVTDIRRVACVGGGVIGSSWAIQFAMRGLDVTLYDINDEQLKKSEGQMHKSLDALENFSAISPERRADHRTLTDGELEADAARILAAPQAELDTVLR